MPVPAEVKTHAAALIVSLVGAGLLEEAEAFVDWCEEYLDLNLSYALPAELEED